MSTRCTLGVLVLLAGACLAPAAKGEEQKAEEKGHGAVEGVLGTAVGQAREQLEQFGDQLKVRARDLERAVYGNYRARTQEALRRTAVITEIKRLTETTGAKILGPGLLIADGGASVAGAGGGGWRSAVPVVGGRPAGGDGA